MLVMISDTVKKCHPTSQVAEPVRIRQEWHAYPGVIHIHSKAQEEAKGSPMRRTFSKNDLEETWEFYQETQGPKTLDSIPEPERQVFPPHHVDHAHQYLHNRCNGWCNLVQNAMPKCMNLLEQLHQTG